MIYEVTKAYLEKHRHYHNLTHIFNMLKCIEICEWELTRELCYAVWFHDVVYIPGNNDNEEKSVEFLKKHLFGEEEYECLPAVATEITDLFEKVSKAILDTKNHIATTELSKQLIDLDLSILSVELFDYSFYLSTIRKEYLFCTSEEWRIGRTKWINKMLEKEKIYYTEKFSNFEKKARMNLEYEKKFIQSS